MPALRERATAISKPGETFTIQNIDFSPSHQEIEKTRSHLRSTLYELSKNELANLNKTYNSDHFYLHSVNFLSDERPRMMQENMRLSATAKAYTPAMAVSNELTLSAIVVFASNAK